MKNWIRHLRTAWKFCQYAPYTELPHDFWRVEDAKAWSNFKTGDTGVKINFILRNKVAQSADRAVMESSDKAQYLCGVAFGIKSTVAELDSLLDLARTREGMLMSGEEMEELFKSMQ
jgi:hypothetical protein